jgi:nicotinamide riboside transporter PnuC
MIWSFILSGLAVLGLYFTGKKKPIGWLIGLFNSGLWVIYAIVTAQYGFMLSTVFFVIIQAKSYMEWTGRSFKGKK